MSIMQLMESRDGELANSLGRLAYSSTDKFNRYFLHGVLRLKDSSAKKGEKKPPIPVYVAETATGLPMQDVAIYKAQLFYDKNNKPILDSDNQYQFDKRFKIIESSTVKKYRGDTPLTALANKLTKPKSKKIVKYDPPIFISTVELGTDTFTKEYGQGIKEYEPAKLNIETGRIEAQKPTGVFICLNSFYWYKKEMLAKDVVSYVKSKEQQDSLR